VMGLFDNIFGGHTPNKQFGKGESFAAILLGAVASDGHIADEEVRGLVTIMARMKMYENWTDEKFNSMLNRILGMIKREGVDKVIERASEGLPEALRETAFANACDLVLADGVVEDEEKEFLDKLQKRLEITGDTALDIVQVMIIKNRG
ncbi:MAG TPA: tellurite resistance TerB family protein, partial [Gemmataceae bacterium]